MGQMQGSGRARCLRESKPSGRERGARPSFTFKPGRDLWECTPEGRRGGWYTNQSEGHQCGGRSRQRNNVVETLSNFKQLEFVFIKAVEMTRLFMTNIGQQTDLGRDRLGLEKRLGLRETRPLHSSPPVRDQEGNRTTCLLYTSDAADE